MERSVEIKVKRLVAAVEPTELPFPTYQTKGSAGADLYAAVSSDIVLTPGERALVPTGISLELPWGYEAQVRPRSGLALKHGVTTLNAPGTIDADYRGEVGVLLINHGSADFTVSRGDRIAQLVIAPVTQGHFIATAILSNTDRGHGGFGHTGMNALETSAKPRSRS